MDRTSSTGEFVALVVLLGVTAIAWWSLAPALLPDAGTNVLLLGEVVFQVAVILGVSRLWSAWRRSRQVSTEPTD